MEKITNVLIVDTETTGLDPNNGAKLIEIGALLYSVKHKAILQEFSTLLPCEENAAEKINKINPAITEPTYNTFFATSFLCSMASTADAIVAHNKQFDLKFMRTHSGMDIQFFTMPWICTKDDFKWPIMLKRKRLQDICEAYGVSYANAHRALADCRLIADCFSQVAELERELQLAMQPRNTMLGSGGRDFR